MDEKRKTAKVKISAEGMTIESILARTNGLWRFRCPHCYEIIDSGRVEGEFRCNLCGNRFSIERRKEKFIPRVDIMEVIKKIYNIK